MTQVLIVSDIRLYWEGLSELLTRDGRLEIAGTASSLAGALAALARRRADVVLLDMATPDALQTARTIFESSPAIKVLALGVSEKTSDVIACAEAGVAGYVCRESSFDDLVAAVERAVRGELRCAPKIAGALLSRVAKLAAHGVAGDGEVYLTPRENDVVQLLDDGLTNQQIAGRLHIQVSTVKIHVHNILEKLGVHHRGEATAKLRRSGLLRPYRAPRALV